MAHRSNCRTRPASADGTTLLDGIPEPLRSVAVLTSARALIDTLDLGAHSAPFGPAHACVADVVVTVTVPDVGQFDSRWCLACLEDSDPLDGLYRLVPGSSVSVRAGA